MKYYLCITTLLLGACVIQSRASAQTNASVAVFAEAYHSKQGFMRALTNEQFVRTLKTACEGMQDVTQAEAVSPDRLWVVNVFVRNGGAMVDYTTHVCLKTNSARMSPQKQSAALQPDDPTVRDSTNVWPVVNGVEVKGLPFMRPSFFSVKGAHQIKVAWVNDKKILVSHDFDLNSAKLYRFETNVLGIEIVYTNVVPMAPRPASAKQ